MDSNRFDTWTRNRALRLSRRDAFRLAGVGTASAARAARPLEAFGQPTCTLTLHGETGAGPSAPAVYDGLLQFVANADGTLVQTSFTPSGGTASPASGSVTGRAFDLSIALSSGQTVVLAGTTDQKGPACPTAAAGILSGPQPGDLGGWQAVAGTSAPAGPVTSNPGSAGAGSQAVSSCPPGQTLCGGACTDPTTDSENCGSCGTVCDSGECNSGLCGSGSTCIPDGEACRVPADCCSLLCPHDPQLPGVCGCSQVGGVCRGIDDCCQQGGDSQVACLGGANDDRCIVVRGACTSDSDCLGQSCVNGMCGSGCADDGAPCNGPADCCSQECHFGLCGCAKLGQSCNEAIDYFCCDGAPTICLNNTCCIMNGSPCSADADCCDYIQGNGSCTNGVCVRPT